MIYVFEVAWVVVNRLIILLAPTIIEQYFP